MSLLLPRLRSGSSPLLGPSARYLSFAGCNVPAKTQNVINGQSVIVSDNNYMKVECGEVRVVIDGVVIEGVVIEVGNRDGTLLRFAFGRP